MRATSFSINLPGRCDASCPFCISRLTALQGSRDIGPLLNGIPKAARLTQRLGIDTLVITGRGEPMLDDQVLTKVVRRWNKYSGGTTPRIEVQTNGNHLNRHLLNGLFGLGVTSVSVSAASIDPQRSAEIMGLDDRGSYWDSLRCFRDAGFLPRLSLNLIDEDFHPGTFFPDYDPRVTVWLDRLASEAVGSGVKQITLRELGVPRNEPEGARAGEWVKKHGLDGHHARLIEATLSRVGTAVYKLEYGPTVYSYQGISWTVATCMAQEVEPSENIRSLVLQPDGFIHVGWEGCPLM
jgi:hypothetical protein